MKFRFPIVIIDEDCRWENTSGLGIRALAKAIEEESMEVLGVTGYGDLSQFAQQQSRASAFILSIDDEEFRPGPEIDQAVVNLRAFIEEIRFKNAEIPIYLYGETRTSQHIPNDILRELHGFIHMFEDTPEFVARHIIRETRAYLDSLAPPFFRALVDYAQDGSYSWHCPGHSGGVAFLKSPVGQMFHQFFGENMLRADVCNAVDELGQLLDHSGPVAKAERNAARIFNADHCFFVTNGTSTSNKMVWHANVAPGDIVVVDRNCHVSILHALTMTGPVHKLLAGLSQASQILVQESERRKLDRHIFNEAYLMHTSTSPQYAIIASCDVAAAMMEPPGGTALVEESIIEALDFRRAMRKVDEEFGKDWWFKVWGPEKLAAEGIGSREDWILRPGDSWHGFGNLAPDFNMLDPIKATVITPGLDVCGNFANTGIPASIVTKYLAEHGVIVEKTGLYSFFIMFTIGITKGRWNTLLTALQQFKDDYDKNQPMWRILPEFCQAHPRYERLGMRDLCEQIHGMYKANDVARLTTEMYLSDMQPAMKPSDAFAAMAHREIDRVEIDKLEGRVTSVLLTPYPPGIPLLVPGERFNPTIVRYLQFAREFNRTFPGFDTDIHCLAEENSAGEARYFVDCVRQS